MSKGAKLVQMQEGFLPVISQAARGRSHSDFRHGLDDELSFEKYGDYLRLADYYTPNTKEALKITGRDTPEEALRVLAEYFEHPLVKLDKDAVSSSRTARRVCCAIFRNSPVRIPPVRAMRSLQD